MTSSYSKNIMRERFGSPELLPDIILEIRENTRGRRYWLPYVAGHYRILVHRPEYGYVILKKL
jgi:hypothetical protein